ncbi:MAG TPA: penicillin-binding protein 2 [Terracidiphilus sp.]|nr:penicillin-binding protein 2 [Terracidiphilus sp.]
MDYGSGTREEKLSTLKLTVVQYGILFMMLALAAGLWRLQVLGADNFRLLAEQNRVRKVPVMAARGKLFDRENRLVVDNYPSVSCFLVREQNRNVDNDLPLIARGLNLDLDQLRATLRRYRAAPGYQPIPIKLDITADEQAFIEAHRNELPELETIDEERRLYPRDGFAAHLIGYVGEVSEEDLNNQRFSGYEPGDVVGKAGVEETYDELLRGQDGSRDVIVDSHGREVGYLRTQHAIPGQDLKLTIDIDIQRAAELALGDRSGAVVAMDPRNGEILAMVSHPSYDPNAFAVRINRADWNQLINDPNHPLMNKAIQAQLAPGSTFKILMSVAGLQEGVAQKMHVNCQGGAFFYGQFHACDRHHGMVDIEHAIPWSCDTFYYTLADKLGIDTIARYAKSVGFGQRTGVDLPNEAVGIVPSSDWKLKNYHEKWYVGETISVGIGQGPVTVTPIQLARMIAGIASNGHFVRPHVVDTDQLPAPFRQALKDTFPGSGEATIDLDPENWMTITEGMAGATDPGMGGTAAASHLEGVDFAGKTGTAQVASHEAIKQLGGGKEFLPNGWFVGVIPRRNPEFVVAVLWEHGDWGSNAAKLASQVATVYVNKKRIQDQNALASIGKSSPVEMGAVWTEPATAGRKPHSAAGRAAQTAQLRGGHFPLTTAPLTPAKNVAGSLFPWPAWLLSSPLRFKEGQP